MKGMHIDDLERVLTILGACEPAMTWLRSSGCKTFEEAWNDCPRGSWLVWLATAVCGEPAKRKLIEAAKSHAIEVVNGLLVGAFEDVERCGNKWKAACKASADIVRTHIPMTDVERALQARLEAMS